MHKRVEACVHVGCPSVVTADDLTYLMGQDMTDRDKAEYDDKDEEPCPQCLHDPTHT